LQETTLQAITDSLCSEKLQQSLGLYSISISQLVRELNKTLHDFFNRFSGFGFSKHISMMESNHSTENHL